MGIMNLMLGAGKTVGSLAIGGAPGRMLLGGAIGGTYGYASSDANSETNLVKDAFRGAAIGAGIGGASRLISPAVNFTSQGMKTSGFPVVGKTLGLGLTGTAAGVGAIGVGIGVNVGKFVLNHPFLTAGTIGTVAAGYGITDELLYDQTRTDIYGDERRLQTMQGSPVSSITGTGSQRALIDSTNKLVFGLHSRRH